ncbi:MAG: phosphatidylglycerophosphatase A [candidate division KSB1 bacterium]|nr:phosphatidylglycerophosphatase A [candidate division KSB1 bacterium]MDZ7319296.1 phosphatidylglycerophosphatase A [candidate division KSB1 bacterium]MDZ7342602.1 phosphatidylglycerophosphatase A [candidate division KSB1 bacterium]
MMKFLARLISTGLGIGYSPIAPGTMGALVIAILYWFAPPITLPVLLGVILILTMLGIPCATITEREMIRLVGDERGEDPSIVIIDEIIGMLVTLIAIPKTGKLLLLAFLLFRFFDIVKPFPIRKVEQLPEGWGIVFDDVVAGIYANLVLQAGLIIF